MRRAAIIVLSAVWPALWALGLGAAIAPTVVRAGNYDGSWMVWVITERGRCEHVSNYEVRVANGKVLYNSHSSVMLWGTVSPGGEVRVAIRHFDDGADGVGRLTPKAGSGVWHGVGKNGPCLGRWEARKR
jgi:hypothetical protein